jgi:hypothetical protein
MKRSESDSSIQRKIEKLILSEINISKGKVEIHGVGFEFDGYNENDNHVFEISSVQNNHMSSNWPKYCSLQSSN